MFMKKVIIISSYLVALVVSLAFTLTPPDKYEVSSGYSIGFKSADPSGNFKLLSGTVEYDSDDVTNTKFNLKIPVSSINTGNGSRDKKAQTEEWFDAKKYPNITFVSSKVEKNGTSLSITGNLSIKGVTKKYTIPATVSESGKKIIFKGSFKVNRIEFGVGKKSDVVPDYMNVSFVVPATKK
jgi:polyisoprenoid-binding protein YceI